VQFHESDTIEMRWHMAVIIGKDIIKRYNKVVLGPCSFTVEQGKTLAVLGPSGSGKSTLFKACAHLLETEGKIEIKDLKRCVVVFDEPNCLNTLNVFDNIALGMKKEGYLQEEIDHRVHEIAAKVGLHDQLLKRPDELSSGQRQRCALARALVRDFDVLLMDEPFSNLDVLLRREMLNMLKQMQKEKGFTCLYVTHDPQDPKLFSDQVMILKEGKIEMLATVEECQAHPSSAFVEALFA